MTDTIEQAARVIAGFATEAVVSGERREIVTLTDIAAHAVAQALHDAGLLAGGWRPMSDFTGSGHNHHVIVAVPERRGSWTIGEAWLRKEGDSDDGWWWSNMSPEDYGHDLIWDMQHGEPAAWIPLPSPPEVGA